MVTTKMGLGGGTGDWRDNRNSDGKLAEKVCEKSKKRDYIPNIKGLISCTLIPSFISGISAHGMIDDLAEGDYGSGFFWGSAMLLGVGLAFYAAKKSYEFLDRR